MKAPSPCVILCVQNDLMENEEDSAAVAMFKRSMSASLREQFATESDDTARHPFVVATVLDPAVKAMTDFLKSMRAAACGQIRALVDNTRTRVQEDGDADGTEESDEPPSKRAKHDVRSVTLSFTARRGESTQATPTAEFDRYLCAVAAPEGDLLT